MFCPSRLKILFCIQVFFGLYNAIVSNEDILKSMSLEGRTSFFGTEDDSISECDVAELLSPSRSKRSGKEPVEMLLNAFGSLLAATLYVVEDNDLISRSRTGLWIAQSSSIAYQNVTYDPSPHIFDAVGDFEFLQNVAEGSAVTRFWDSNGNENIVGVLKQDYTVKSASKEVEYAFIDISTKNVFKKRSANPTNDQNKKRSFVTICKNAGVSQEYFRRNTYAKIDVRPDPNLHRPRRQSENATKVPDVVNPKLLVIPDVDTITRYKYVGDFIVQLLAQLNYVDMMFRQLDDPEVHLNIVGIIIPMDNVALPYISENINTNNQIIGDATLFEAKQNFLNEIRRFPEDTWDFILMLTAYPIAFYTDNVGNVIEVDGFSSVVSGCSKAAAIVRCTDNIKGIFNLAHGLGYMFGAKRVEAGSQCKDIGSFLTSNDYSAKFEWSNCSRADFQTYFRSNSEHCTFSRPWRFSSKVKSMPGAWLTLDGQCDNLHNDSTSYCLDSNNFFRSTKKNGRVSNCFIYGCLRNGSCDWKLDPPLEGSLYFDKHELQVCVTDSTVPV